MNDVSLSDLRAFAAVAQYRSFRRAAEEIGTSRSALSHALRSLERRLDIRLLHRTTRSVAPTEAGEALLARIAPLLGDLDAALAEAGRPAGELTGTLRINANEGGARWLLRHAVPIFAARHPRVTLDLVTEGRLVDIVAEGFDAGVRLLEAVPQDMIAVPFGGTTRFLAVAAPAHVERYGRPRAPADLADHPCIRQRLPSGRPYRWEFERAGREIALEVPGTLILDNSALMVEAAEQGLGIAFVPEAYAREPLDAGRLVLLLEDWSPPFPGGCLYYASHRHVPATLRAFIDAIREGDPS
ncbi:LysR family transcriptional regulator [Sphingomonas sp. Y38-1Y]|uniref:LysR family transcriptional regulator n=1 Tax=Sphingomonas sp. Y38-1Y TaxID=3078265 RepID=UPI0028EA55D0|nr:LysR family transcriptional regulator [Sphingomonas sp. Y38-1Y]